MKMLKAFMQAACISMLLSSCAGKFYPIHSDHLVYTPAAQSPPEVSFGYRYNVLTETNNKKFAKAEEKRKVDLVAVEITNHSDRPLLFGEDIHLYVNGQRFMPMTKERTYSQLKQHPGFFFFYLSGMSLNYSSETTVNGARTDYTFVPIGLIVAPVLAFTNYAKAKKNNKNLLEELSAFDLNGKTIAPGETVHGLVGLKNALKSAIEIRFSKKKTAEPRDEEYYEEYYIEQKE